MYKRTAVILILLLTAIVSSLFYTQLIKGELSVGVKQGDWIEYQVAVTGTPDPDHDITWARMEVVGIQGKAINLEVATEFSNGTILNETITLNLETGQLGDDFIIPANLNSGDKFFDIRQGNMTINGVEERTYAGAVRTIVSGATLQTAFYWDRATGILVEGNSLFTDFTMNTKVDKTNMWQAQISGSDSFIVYTLVIAAVVILVVAAFFVVHQKK